METQAKDDKKSADARNVDIEMILPEHEQHRAGAKAKLSDVDIVKLAPGENFFYVILPSWLSLSLVYWLTNGYKGVTLCLMDLLWLKRKVKQVIFCEVKRVCF